MSPQQGREQAGRRPVICLSPRSYNRKSGLAVFCPITSKEKGYPFEVAIDAAKGMSSVVLTDQIKSLDWRKREFVFITAASKDQIQQAAERASLLIAIEHFPAANPIPSDR